MAVPRVADRRRRKVNSKERPANSGIRRSSMVARNRSVQRVNDHRLDIKKTAFGQAAMAVEGPYEIMFEVMAPKCTTGLIVSGEGTVTIFCKNGSLHVHEDDKGSKTHKMLHVGEFVTMLPGTVYSLSTNETAADLVKMQTPKYIESIKQVSSSVAPGNIDFHVDLSGFISQEHSVEAAAATRHVREPRDRNKKIKIAEMVASDKGRIDKRRGVTREARPPRAAREVLENRTFQQNGTAVQGVNLAPLSASQLDAMYAADVVISSKPTSTE